MKSKFIFTALLALTAIPAIHAEHNHAYAGDFNSDGYLDFGDTVTGNPVSNLGGRTMAYEGSGTYFDDGFAFNGTWTPTALDGSNSSISNVEGALNGTFVNLVLYSVTGPVGATFGFYENGATDVTLSLGTGMTGGTGAIALTGPDFSVNGNGNPYGHNHGRRWVATEEGEYTITWALANGESGGTLGSQAAGNPGPQFFTMTFTAIPEPGTIALIAIAATIGIFAWRRRRAV